ncbi:DUF2971 domain-containing protein [Pseudomonas sp. MG-9]|uniref:DUF2971 domain-containing protein n=1 Tax=Pseudomonas serboccidentalis TaxID=2964670 RepID=A0ABY7ZF64_9PSED|nr:MULTISPECIES: DUF2971 domain-containing protein [Pseudomonas]MBT9263462.1 DUF2971 domain-containing protein [Pseudomonas sp. MG-9]WDR37910.1 DUF2971 domain-containing protein [Pseudomonas serboccidentalis]
MGRVKTRTSDLRSTLPEFFYKYSPIESISPILESSSIKVADPTGFNDPFDCNFPLLDLNKINVLKMLKLEFGKSLGLSNNSQFNQEMNRLRPRLNEMTEEVIRLTSEMAREWDVLLSRFRVLSLTTKPDNILMWSHYANYHKGAVLKFKSKAPAFKSALKVKYGGGEKLMSMFLTAATTDLARSISQGRPESEVDKLAAQMSTKNLELLFRYLLIKRDEWAYEQEYRVILSVDSPEVTQKPECNLDTVSFAAEDLSEIIFGVNTPAKEMQNVENLVQLRFPDVRITRAQKRGLDLFFTDGAQA